MDLYFMQELNEQKNLWTYLYEGMGGYQGILTIVGLSLATGYFGVKSINWGIKKEQSNGGLEEKL